MNTQKKEQLLNCSDFNQLLDTEYGKRGTPVREQFEAEAEVFALGELLQQQRKSAGLTQQQLARQAGSNKSTVSRIERGNLNVSLDSIFRIFSGMGRKVAISVLTLTLLLTLGVGQMWASTTATLYYSIPASTVGCYTVKCYYNFGYSQTGTVEMTKEGYNGTDVVYSVTVTADHDNVDDMKFQLWNGGSWVSEKQVLSGWVALDKNGKMYSYSSNSWGTKTMDASGSYKIYFVNKDSWSSRYTYAYYADCHNNWSWPGQSMTSASKKYNGKDIYYIDLSSRFPSVIFNNNSGSETSSIACYSNRGKMYYDGSFITLQYDVTLDQQSGSDGTSSIIATCGSAMPGSKTAPSRTGYTFGGYYTSTGGGGTKYYNADMTSAATWPSDGSGPTTLYAKWTENTYSLTFANDGHGTVAVGGASVSSGSSATVNYHTTKTLVATPATGYNFNNWTLSGTNTGAVTIGSTTTASTTIKATATGATVTANFAANTTTITLNKGDHGAANQTATVNYDATALTSITAVSPSGMYELTGYYTSSDVKVLNADGSFAGSNVTGYITSDKWSNASSAVTLYAHWDAVSTYTVSYSAGGGSGSMSSNTGITSGGSQTISTNSFTRSGYTFSHWTADVAVTANSKSVAAGGTIAAGATLSNITSNIALTANWIENDYTVTVTAGSNGSVASGSVTGHKDTKVTLPTATANTGYHFDTWTTTTGSVTYDNKTSASTAQVYGLSADATVRADFAANTYSVVFNANGGTGSMSNEAFTYDASAKALTSNSFSKSGYTFVGWATSAARANAMNIDYTNGQSVQNLTSTNGGTFNLYAVWAKKYYIGGRFQHDWEDGTTTTNEMTYDATTGYYKFETNKTVNELSVQWHNVSGDYYANQVFFIHTGNGKTGSSSNPFYTTPNEDGAGLNFETSNSYANALVLANQETTWGEIVTNRLVQFSNTDNLSSNVIVWWDPANKKVWYTATESLNTNYYLLGFGTGNWSETDARRFTVASLNATTATVTVSLTAKTYTGGDNEDGFKVKNGSNYYGNTGTMTRANCSNWSFTTGSNNNCGIPADMAGTYTFTLNLSTMQVSATYPTESGFTVTTTSSAGGSADAASYTAYEFTTTAISATPSTGYYFTGWEATSGSVDFADASSASTTINGVTAAATIRANFAPMWVIAGGDSQNGENGDDVMGNWSTSANQIVNIGTNANSKDTGYVEITLPANTTFYFKVKDVSLAANAGWYGNSNSTQYMTYAANNMQPWTFGTDGSNTANCGITTAGAGTYKFAWNITDKKVSVHFPTSYTVTFGYGTGGSEVTATVEDATTITSGQYAAAGKDITFTQTPSTGYTFKGWYTTSDGNSAVTGMGTSDAVYDDIAANINVYAQYTEDMHTVTVTAGEHGSITTPAGGSGSTVSAGIATGAAIVAAVADYGYYFQGWTVESGSATFANASALSTTVYATADATIKANFVSHWTIAGGNSGDPDGADAMGDWSTVANGIDNFEEVNSEWIGYVDIDLPANTTFYFKVRDLYDGSAWYGNTGEMTIDNSTGWLMTLQTSNCSITTAGKGTYRFTWNETTKHLTVTYPTSYTVSYSVYTFLGNDESNSESTTGGSISSVVDGDAIALTSGKYVVSGGTAVFTHAAAATNYHFAGWYSDAACETAYVDGEGDAAITDEVLTLTVSGNKTVYAKFAETMTTVNIAHNAHGHVELGGETVTSATAGVYTTRTITAVPDAGWYFAGWTVSDGADCNVASTDGRNDNEPSSTTLSGLGIGTTGTVTANFVENDKVYFRNWNDDADAPLWENVYVYFNISFEDDCAKSSTNSSYIVQMTQIGESNVYWAYVPRAVYNVANIAFSNHEFGTNYKFYQHEAVKRGDYNRALSMFVPRHSDTEELNKTNYYKGYWKHYGLKAGSDAGYRIERYNGSTYEQPSDNGGDRVKFLVVNDNTIEYQLRVDNQEEGHNNYMIYSEAGIHYITFDGSPVVTGYTVTTANHSDIGLTEYTSGSPRFYITPTSEGVYKLVIDMSHDMMRLSVIYPVAVGDYMLVHNYNDGSAKISRSDIIKPDEVASRLYSMYIDNITAHTKSLKLKKCTALTEGVPVWSAGEDVSMSGFKADTAGVFQFNVAIAADNATLSDIATYHGNYYIKTDCADGGWTAYKSNILEHNSSTFSASDPKTYDYYFCRWVESDMYDGDNNTNFNVKCVVANDYNNALSDTLTGDAIIGVNNDVLPYNANVRFSYNSVTNELRRAYINGATDWQESFLRISAGDASQIRSKYTHTAYSGNDTTLTDKNNWIYQLDLEAHTNARVKLTANYRFNSTDHEQYFKGNSGDYTDANTEQIIQGTSADTWFPLRVVYDFKIDKLIAGYLPGNTNVTSSEAIYSDVLIIRNGQGDGTQLTFSTGKELSNVKTVYGVMEFNKSDIQNTGLSRYTRNTYWVSFPFDVRLDQVTGFGDYGKEWIIQYYDGATRAEKGAWKDSPNFWTYVMPSERNAGFVMKANEGYLVSLSLNNMTPNDFWKNGVTTVSLYFPSKDPVETINGTLPSAASYVVPEHPCTIERDGRYFKDANWNIIGVPSYANLTRGVQEEVTINGNSVSFLYRHNTGNNHMEVQSLSGSFTFGVMKSYMVQYAGTIDWTSTIPSEVAARRAPESDNKTLDLQILDGEGQLIDRAFVRFSDESTDGLDLNKDLYKFFNEGGNVYTLCSDVELAAQILPLGEGTLSIPVGVKADGNTTVEFAMPEGTEGMEVYLYDKQDGTYTNLLTSTRQVTLNEGKTNDRFILMVKEAKMPTAVISTEQDAENTVKYLRNGHLFIKRGGRLYNAEGKLVNNVK